MFSNASTDDSSDGVLDGGWDGCSDTVGAGVSTKEPNFLWNELLSNASADDSSDGVLDGGWDGCSDTVGAGVSTKESNCTLEILWLCM